MVSQAAAQSFDSIQIVDSTLAVDPDQTVRAADAGLQAIMAEEYRAIPRDVLNEASALVIYPERKDLTVLASKRDEYGVLVVRSAEGDWERPRFVRGRHKSLGMQVGYQRSTSILAIMNRDRVDGFVEGGHKAYALNAQLGLGGVLSKLRLKPRHFGGTPWERRYTMGGTFGGGVYTATTITTLDTDAEKAYYGTSEQLPESAVTLLNRLREYASSEPSSERPAIVPLAETAEVSTERSMPSKR